jgi:hypothetical protein
MLLILLMFVVLFHCNVGYSRVQHCPWKWFCRGVSDCYVLMTSNHYVPATSTLGWSAVVCCVYELISLCKMVFCVVLSLVRAERKFYSALGVNWTCNKWWLVKNNSDLCFGRICMLLCKFHLMIFIPHTCSQDESCTPELKSVLFFFPRGNWASSETSSLCFSSTIMEV